MSDALTHSAYDLAPFAEGGSQVSANGFSPIPIAPGDKIPGLLAGDEWRFHRGWNRYCSEAPGKFQIDMWSRWPRAGLGVACGRGLIAVDIDRDELVAPILAVLPPRLVAKRGRKGETVFFRGDTDKLRSRNFKIDRLGVLDFLSFGKQTVLPPSIHPATGLPYEWTTERTLLDTRLSELPEITEAHFEAMVGVLRANGYEPEPEPDYAALAAESTSDASDFFRRLNEDALNSLDAWVPKVGLVNARREPDGSWRAVADWRPSSSGRPVHRRSRNLSIDRRGIKDFGDGDKTYTALNLVMRAHDANLDRAAVWLGEAIGYDFTPKIVLQPKPKPKPDFACPTAVEVDPNLAKVAREDRSAEASEPCDAEQPVFRLKSDFGLSDLTRPPGLVGEIIDWIEASATYPSRELALGAALGWVSALAGRGFETPSQSPSRKG